MDQEVRPSTRQPITRVMPTHSAGISTLFLRTV
nr:MAG TPA: hypothetical protein [Caudoviricetes sp.]